jgi:hypothetical protein
VHSLAGPGALDRGGVDHPDVVVGDSGLGAEHAHQPRHRGGQLPQPLVVARLLGQVREHQQQMGPGETQPPGLAGVAQQGLHYRQRQQFGVADLWRNPDSGSDRDTVRMSTEQIIGGHIECGGEGVQIGVPEGLQVRVG